MIDMSTIKSIHFIGIGGVSVSAIAEILHTDGYEVSGSDMASSKTTELLSQKGFKIYIGHSAENIGDVDLVVYTSAVSEDNPEMARALALNIPCFSRAEMLGQIMLNYPDSIAISGTHGKTTTTSMVTRLLNDEVFDPTALVGGFFNDIQSNVKIGASDLFITEACEYKESFLSFYPKIGVILNIDEDHLDYYRDIDHIVSAFVKFSGNLQEDGLLIYNGDDFNSKKIMNHYQGQSETFGITDNSTYNARNIVYNAMGFPTFDVYKYDQFLSKVSLSIPGLHNIYNALASYAVACQFTKDYDLITSRLNTFKNANRRFERIGKVKDVLIIDEYAHHPSEIKATLEAASRIEAINRIVCVFQPHTYTRTKELLNEFSCSFKFADEVIVTDIYAAREADLGIVHSKDLLTALLKEGVNARYYASFEDIIQYLKATCMANDLVMSVGAGDVYKISHGLYKTLSE